MLAFAEGVARYLAWVLTAEAAAKGATDKQLKGRMRAKGFGSFLAVIDECLSARRARDDVFLPEVEGLWSGNGGVVLARANAVRNDVMHNRVARDPVVAERALRELEPEFQKLLDALAFLPRYPLGVLHRARTAHGSVVEAHWLPCRGLSLHNQPVLVRNAAGVPTDQALLLDLDGRRALSLAPFFVCNLDVFCWLDIPAPEDSALRGVYQRPTSTDPLPSWVPRGLVNIDDPASHGFSLEEWLCAPQRPRIIPLAFDEDAIARLRIDARSTPQSEAPQQAPNVGAAVQREALTEEVDKIFARARTRIYKLRQGVGFTTSQEEFAREMKQTLDETDTALSRVLSKVSFDVDDDVSRLPQSTPGSAGSASTSSPHGPRGGALEAAGVALGAAGLLLAPLAIGALSVAKRKQRMLDACDVALANFDDTHEAALKAIANARA
ncbi:MAG: hypothetical protein U0326_24060 [Polyangiales bacterium]